MKKKIRLLRICYWWGIITDALAAIVMLSPKLAGLVYGIPNFNPGSDYKYAMGIGASLMLGWTFVLFWADRKPVERKGILLLTIFPVVIGMLIANIYAVINGLIVVEKMIPTWMLQGLLTTFFIFTYFYTNDVKREKI